MYTYTSYINTQHAIYGQSGTQKSLGKMEVCTINLPLSDQV